MAFLQCSGRSDLVTVIMVLRSAAEVMGMREPLSLNPDRVSDSKFYKVKDDELVVNMENTDLSAMGIVIEGEVRGPPQLDGLEHMKDAGILSITKEEYGAPL